MTTIVTGKIIKELREKQNLTQQNLAKLLNVTDKTISKWETGKGLPDISLIDQLAKHLKVSVTELMQGNSITNSNKAGNIKKSKFYVCPNCGNIIFSMGETLHICCGNNLTKLEEKPEDERHIIDCKRIENELYVSLNHEMTKNHYVSFIAYVTMDRCEIVKLYPEQNAETRFLYKGSGVIYVFYSKDGLFKKKI